jgi:hypothetical protein
MVGLALTVLVAFLFWRRHNGIVLLHAFADTRCACGDFHDEVSGVNILNPLRDRQPERAAEQFFQEAAHGRCSARYDAGLCQYYEREAPIKGWKLVNAISKDDGIDLFYKLDSSKKDRVSHTAWTGEGCVHVNREAGGWRVSWYSAYF